MVVFSIGLPSRFADWCDGLLVRLVEQRFGSVQCVSLNSLEELAAAVIKSSALSLVASSRQPVVRLQTEIVQAGHPFLVALGDPRTALRNLVEQTGSDLAHATRAVASSCAALIGITQAPNALVLNPTQTSDVPAIAAAIAEHLRIPVGPDELAAIAGQASGEASSDEEANRLWLGRLSERERAVVNGALEPYIAHFAGHALERLVWEPELFYTASDPPAPMPTPAVGPIDITGRPRAVIFGPYISLPPGAWSVDVVIGFSAEAAGMSFMLEVVAGARLAETRVEATGERVVEIRLYITVGESIEHPIEIRIFNERAAFDGRLALGYAALTPQAALPEQTRQRLADVLQRQPDESPA